jgi:hypothetical protein
MTERNLEGLVKEYLEAFETRDLSHCLDFYEENATLIFHTGIYRGKPDIETWHKDRFAANLRLVELDEIVVKDETVTVEGTATSDRLRAWKIASLKGIITFLFQENKIKEAKFGAQMRPLQMLYE